MASRRGLDASNRSTSFMVRAMARILGPAAPVPPRPASGPCPACPPARLPACPPARLPARALRPRAGENFRGTAGKIPAPRREYSLAGAGTEIIRPAAPIPAC
nr:hypothetical protein StreXyl84_30930 [Streptomyces sp. Xyl84]